MKKVSISGYMSDEVVERINLYLSHICADFKLEAEEVEIKALADRKPTKRIITNKAKLDDVKVHRTTRSSSKKENIHTLDTTTGCISNYDITEVYDLSDKDSKARYDTRLVKNGINAIMIYDLMETAIPDVYKPVEVTETVVEDEASKDISGYFIRLVSAETKDYAKIKTTAAKVAKNKKHSLAALSRIMSIYHFTDLNRQSEEEIATIREAFKTILMQSSMGFYELTYELDHYYRKLDAVFGKEYARDLLCDFFTDRYPSISKEVIKESPLYREKGPVEEITLDELIICPTVSLWARTGSTSHVYSTQRDMINRFILHIQLETCGMIYGSDDYKATVISLAKGYGRLIAKSNLPNEGNYDLGNYNTKIDECAFEGGNAFYDVYLLALEYYGSAKIIKEVVTAYVQANQQPTGTLFTSHYYHCTKGAVALKNINTIGGKTPKLKKAIMMVKLGDTSK